MGVEIAVEAIEMERESCPLTALAYFTKSDKKPHTGHLKYTPKQRDTSPVSLYQCEFMHANHLSPLSLTVYVGFI